MVCGALLLQRALYTVHCTNIMHSRKSSFVITPTVLVNTVNRYILYIRGNKIGHILLKQFPFITFYMNAVKHLCFSPFTWRIDSCSSADQSIENMYIHTHMFVVNFDALAQASDFRIHIHIHNHIHIHIHIHIHMHIHIHIHVHIHILILMQFCHGFNVLWEAERTMGVVACG